MKNILTLLTIAALMVACKHEKNEARKPVKVITGISTEVTPQMMESAVIYEANIRQYSYEGTFDKFTTDIPQLKELGVKIIWLMPIFPISETKRKAFGDTFASDIENPQERQKYLGSYYAITDYTKINPEFGTIEDFRELIKTA